MHTKPAKPWRVQNHSELPYWSQTTSEQHKSIKFHLSFQTVCFKHTACKSKKGTCSVQLFTKKIKKKQTTPGQISPWLSLAPCTWNITFPSPTFTHHAVTTRSCRASNACPCFKNPYSVNTPFALRNRPGSQESSKSSNSTAHPHFGTCHSQLQAGQGSSTMPSPCSWPAGSP